MAPSAKGVVALLLATLAITITGNSCSRVLDARPGMLSRWENHVNPVRAESSTDPAVPQRALAEAQPRCLKDRLTLPNLRADVAKLEAAAGGARVNGAFRGVDKSTLSPVQARFVSVADGGWIHSEGVSIRSCADAPCIINRVYGVADDSAIGVKLYWWYLRMGYVLSATDTIPGTGAMADKTFRDYLFSERELNAFWKISWTLGDTFRNMASLQTFHRFPPDTFLVQYGESTCGLSTGHRTAGTIKLMDGCLRLNSGEEPGKTGFFYLGVPHEMAHRLDSGMSNDFTSVSEKAEFLALSGWVKDQVTNPVSGQTVSTWRTRNCEVRMVVNPEFPENAAKAKVETFNCKDDPEIDGFVRPYAGTNPGEDFADTIAYFREEPTSTLVISPRKSKWIAEKIFSGRTFDKDGLLQGYENIAAPALSKELLELVQNCVVSPVSATSRTAVGNARLMLDAALPQTLVHCLESTLQDKITTELDAIRATEWEACDYLVDNEQALRARLFARLNPEISKQVGEQAQLADILRASRELRAALPRAVDPRQAYLHCFRADVPQICFQTTLGESFERVAAPFAARLGEAFPREREQFISEHDFERTRVRTTEVFKQFYAGHEELLAGVAEARWKGCIDATGIEGEEPLTRPFTGGARWVSSVVLNCVNRAATDDINSVRDGYARNLGLSVTDADAGAFIQSLLLPGYVASLQASHDKAAAAEDNARNQLKKSKIDAMVAALAEKVSWVSGAGDTASAIARCQEPAVAQFNASSASLPLRFASADEVRREWVNDICARAVQVPAVKKEIERAGGVEREALKHAWTKSIAELEVALAARADVASNTCRAGSRRTDYPTRRRRADCVRAQWAALEAAALQDWDETTLGKRFVWRRPEAAHHLVARRKALQEAAIQRMERR